MTLSPAILEYLYDLLVKRIQYITLPHKSSRTPSKVIKFLQKSLGNTSGIPEKYSRSTQAVLKQSTRTPQEILKHSF
jgi:hypothetical protein